MHVNALDFSPTFLPVSIYSQNYQIKAKYQKKIFQIIKKKNQHKREAF